MTLVRTLKRILITMGVLVGISAIVFAVVGYVTEGTDGLVSALIGAALTLVFSGLTVVSLLLAIDRDPTIFLAIILGVWLGKLVVFIVAILLLRDQPFIVPWVLIVSMLVAAAITLAVDALIVLRARIPYTQELIAKAPPASEKSDEQA
jgi:hypothetical protein